MALDTLGVVSREYRKRLLLRNLINSDDPTRLFHLGLALVLPAQYTTQQSDNRQFIATAISIKNFIKNTFKGGGYGVGENTTPRAFTQQDYTYNKPYPEGPNSAEIEDKAKTITSFPDPQRKTYNVIDFEKGIKITGLQTLNTSKIPDEQELKSQVSKDSDVSQFFWEKSSGLPVIVPQEKNLLSFTQKIVQNLKNESGSVGKVIDQTETTYQNPNDVKNPLTKGSSVKDIDDPQKIARAFTVEKPYSTIGDLIRHDGPYMPELQDNKSALDSNGFVRIAPTKGTKTYGSTENPNMNLMFAIENLAWQGYDSDLPCLEKGPNGGRLMWFPPYGITITDNSTINWASTNFVGRGEPIYTYNNTERTLTLQFKVITDHPSVLNAVKNQDIISVEQFFSATGGKVKETITAEDKLALKYEKMSKSYGVSEAVTDKAEVMLKGTDINIGTVTSSFSVPPSTLQTIYYSANTFGFLLESTGNTKNSGFDLNNFIDKLYEVIDKVDISLGGASSDKYVLLGPCLAIPIDFASLSKRRMTNFEEYIIPILTQKANDNGDAARLSAIKDLNFIKKEITADSIPGCEPGAYQVLTIRTKYNPSKDRNITSTGQEREGLEQEFRDFASNRTFLRRTIPLCESEYFEAMQSDERFALFDNLRERLDFFHPGFHSMTPEGFNSRLTFLLQCSRQGPSIQPSIDTPANMVFGRPPVCVLRIGDFYYTKVVIDSVNISYDDSLWDLNPEGIGIQPMIATVDLNMKVVGGSSLTGAITKLQNALSYHFFANTEVYMGSEFTTGKIIDDKDEAIIAANEAKRQELKDKKAAQQVAKQDAAAAQAKQEFLDANPLSVSGVTATAMSGTSFISTGAYFSEQTCDKYWVQKKYVADVEATITFNRAATEDKSILWLKAFDVGGELLTAKRVEVMSGDTSYQWSQKSSDVTFGKEYYVQAQFTEPTTTPQMNAQALAWSPPLDERPPNKRPPCTCVCPDLPGITNIASLASYVPVNIGGFGAIYMCPEGEKVLQDWRDGIYN